MYPSIPVSEFVNPARGTSAFNAVARALEFKPEVVRIGTHNDETYYRVQRKGSDPHCVILATDVQGERIATCNCMAHHRPQSPLHCLHIPTVLIWEAENREA